MATYWQQIESMFNQYSNQWIDKQAIYDKAKAKLVSEWKTDAINELDNYYKQFNTTPTITSTPAWTTGFTQNTSTWAINDWLVDPKTKSYATQIEEAKKKYPWKSDAEIKTAIESRIKSSNLSWDALAAANAALAQSFGGTWENASKASWTSTTWTQEAIKVSASDNIKWTDNDFTEALQKQIDAIKKEYDEKMKNQQDYTNNIIKMYDANKAEFDVKYWDLRSTITKMEQSADESRNEIKSFMEWTYDDAMKRIATQQAGKHAAISWKLSWAWLSSDIINNALSEAENDPNTMAAIEALKDKQITNLTGLQTNYGNWLNQIMSNKNTLTSAEKDLADEIVKKKEALDLELKNIKDTSITSMFKPIQDYYVKSTESVTWDQIKKEKTQQDIKRYQAATPEERKDILSDKLFNYSPSIDRALVTEDIMREAIAKWSLMDAVAFLSTKIVDRAQAIKLWEIAAQLWKASWTTSTWTSSASSVSTWTTPASTGTTSTWTTSTKSNETKSNVESVKTNKQEAKSDPATWTAELQSKWDALTYDEQIAKINSRTDAKERQFLTSKLKEKPDNYWSKTLWEFISEAKESQFWWPDWWKESKVDEIMRTKINPGTTTIPASIYNSLNDAEKKELLTKWKAYQQKNAATLSTSK